jgi:hypothetical protein
MASVLDERHMSVEHWGNYTDRGKSKYSEKTLPQFHFVHHKLYVGWPGFEPVLR